MTNAIDTTGWATSPDFVVAAPNLSGQVYIIARQRGWEHSPADAAGDEVTREWGDAPVGRDDPADISAEVSRTH